MRQTTGRLHGWLRTGAAAAAAVALLAAAPAAGAAELLAQAQRGPAPGAPVQQPPSIEANIAQLHQELRITPPQEGAFNGFATALRENARAARQLPAPNPRMSAVEGLRITIRATQQELAELQRLLPPLETLYRSLSAQQKRTADQVFSRPPG